MSGVRVPLRPLVITYFGEQATSAILRQVSPGRPRTNLLLMGFRVMLRSLISASCVFAFALVGAGSQVNAESCSPEVIEREISGSNFTALKFSDASTCEWVVPTGVTSVDLLVVGGGGGASTGGGGGGGVLERFNYSVTSGGTVSISVGAGGLGNTSRGGAGSLGGASSFGDLTAFGGGGGAAFQAVAQNSPTTASNGGNGSDARNAQPAVISGQGNLGGVSRCDWYGGAGGGGGAGSAGADGGPENPLRTAPNSCSEAGEQADQNPTAGGDGGEGIWSDITGTNIEYGAGGGGGVNTNAGPVGFGGEGGSVDAGDGARTANGVGTNAVDGSGAGGGGGDCEGDGGGSGGNGVVVVLYANPTLVPTFGAASATADGFSVPVTNYDADFSWAVTTTAGSAVIDSAGTVSVSGLAYGGAATVTVTSSRSGFDDGSADLTSAALAAPLTPAFGASSATADGFSVPVTNYDADFSWAVTTTAGSAVINSAGIVTVSGLDPLASAAITVSCTRNGFVDGSAVGSGLSLGAALVPELGIPVPTSDGFTVPVNNYDASFTWVGTVSSDAEIRVRTVRASINISATIVVSGLSPSESATLTVVTERDGYQDGTASVTGAALAPASPDESSSTTTTDPAAASTPTTTTEAPTSTTNDGPTSTAEETGTSTTIVVLPTTGTNPDNTLALVVGLIALGGTALTLTTRRR